jgi:hypothetical protein
MAIWERLERFDPYQFGIVERAHVPIAAIERLVRTCISSRVHIPYGARGVLRVVQLLDGLVAYSGGLGRDAEHTSGKPISHLDVIQFNAMLCNSMQCNAMQCNAIRFSRL